MTPIPNPFSDQTNPTNHTTPAFTTLQFSHPFTYQTQFIYIVEPRAKRKKKSEMREIHWNRALVSITFFTCDIFRSELIFFLLNDMWKLAICVQLQRSHIYFHTNKRRRAKRAHNAFFTLTHKKTFYSTFLF